MTRYVWPHLTLEADLQAGKVWIRYMDGATAYAAAGDLDRQFGHDLGCTGEDHIVVHELMHQLVGFAFYRSVWGSPVVRRAATGVPQPAQGHKEPEEKMCWALTRMMFGTHNVDPWFEPEWIRHMEASGVDVDDLLRLARCLYDAAVLGVEEVRLTPNIFSRAEAA